MSAAAQETMLQILASSTDGAAIRRRWLGALVERFDAQLGAAQNAIYDVEAETLRYADNVSVGPEAWQALDRLMDGAPVADVVSVEHVAAPNAFGLCLPKDLSPDFVEKLWNPFRIASSLSTNVVEDGRMLGHISILRTEDAAKQFHGDEMRGEFKPWADCTFKLMSVTHAMLCRGPRKRGAVLFRPDGTRWMESELPVEWASEAYLAELVKTVKSFAADQSEERDLYSHNTRISLSRVVGKADEAILVIVEPMAVARMSEISRLTPMERLVSSYAAQGATVEEIATLMSRSAATIKTHLENIYDSLGISSRSELASCYQTAMNWNPE